MSTPALKRDAQGLWWVRTGGDWEGPTTARIVAEQELEARGVRPKGYDLIFDALDQPFDWLRWQDHVLRFLTKSDGPLTSADLRREYCRWERATRYRLDSFDPDPKKRRFGHTFSLFDHKWGKYLKTRAGSRRAWSSAPAAWAARPVVYP